MSYLNITCLVAMALLPGIGSALGGEPVPSSAHHQVLNVPPPKCLDKAKLAFVQFNAGPIQESNGFLGASISAGGSVLVYCLTNGDPNQSWFIDVVASTTGGGANQLEESFRAQAIANP